MDSNGYFELPGKFFPLAVKEVVRKPKLPLRFISLVPYNLPSEGNPKGQSYLAACFN